MCPVVSESNSMAKFKVFEQNQALMVRLGVYSHKITAPTNEFYTSFAAYYITLIFSMGFVTSALFVFLNIDSQTKLALGAFKIAFGTVQWGGVFISIGFKMKKVKALQLKLQEIVDKADDIEINRIFWNAEQLCRNYTNRIYWFCVFHPSEFLIVLIYALYCLATGDSDTSSWMLFFNMTLPLDTSRLLDWFIKWFFQFNISYLYALCMSTLIAFFVSCCNYMNAMYDIFKYLIKTTQEFVERTQNERKQILVHDKIRRNLAEMIEFHIDIFEVFDMLRDINTGVIFSLLPANVIFMSVSILELEQDIEHFVALVFLFDVSCILSALAWPALMCSYATALTLRIATLSHVAYGSNWYDFPAELQKYMVLIIARSQEPVYFTGFGLVRCTLEVFGGLFKTSCSLYLIFKTFA